MIHRINTLARIQIRQQLAKMRDDQIDGHAYYQVMDNVRNIVMNRKNNLSTAINRQSIEEIK